MSCIRQTIEMKNGVYPAARYRLRPNIKTQSMCEGTCVREQGCEGWLFYGGNKCKTAEKIVDDEKFQFKEAGTVFGRVECTKEVSWSGVAMVIFIFAILLILWLLVKCRNEGGGGAWWKTCSS